MKQHPNIQPINYDEINSNPSVTSSTPTKTSLHQQTLNLIFQVPPNQHLAQIHKKANKFGFKRQYDPHGEIVVCPCCEIPLHSRELSIWDSTTPTTEQGVILQSFQLESSVSLYFTFLKFLAVYLLILFLTVNIFSLSMNSITELDCRPDQTWCKSFFLRYSPVKQNIQSYRAYLQVTDYLNLTMVIISIVLFQFYKRYQRKLHATLRMTQRSQQDFSIFVQNLPKIIMENGGISFNYEKVLKNLLQTNYQLSLKSIMSRKSSIQSEIQAENRISIQQRSQTVKSICLCIDTSQLQKMTNFRQELLEQMILSGEMSASATTQARTAAIQNPKLTLLNRQYIQRSQELLNKRSYKWAISSFIGSAFVSFQRQSKRNHILEFYRQNPQLFTMGDKQLKLSIAPMPEDIEWSNLNKQHQKSSNLQFYTLFIILFFLSFLSISYFDDSKIELKGRQISAFKLSQPTSINKSSFIRQLAIAMITHLSNVLIELLANYFVSQQKQMTKTKKYLSITSKTIIAQTINTIGMYLFLSEISTQKNLLKNGIVNKVCYFLFFISTLYTIGSLLQFTILIKKGLLKLFPQKPLLEKGVQLYYNHAKQLSKFDLVSTFSFYIVMIYTTLFFSYIAPLCALFVMMIIIASYWINKYHLFKNSSKPDPLDLQLFERMVKFAQFSIFLFSLGNYYFSYLIEREHSMTNLVALGLAGLYFITIVLEQRFFENLACGQKALLFDSVSYSQCLKKGKFLRNYWMSNPVTMFSEEADINLANKKVDYNLNFRMADEIDLKRKI